MKGGTIQRPSVTRGPRTCSTLTHVEDMDGELSSWGSSARQLEMSLPFTGLWMATNSQAKRVASHGNGLLGERCAIHLFGVAVRHLTAVLPDCGLPSPPKRRSVSSPFVSKFWPPEAAPSRVLHDAELDHEGRRSQLALVPYALSQAARLRQGVGAIAGNVTISLPDSQVKERAMPAEGAVVEPLSIPSTGAGS